jgi:hypothetical protein
MKKMYLLFLLVCLIPAITAFGQKTYERPSYIDNINNVQEITADELMAWDMTGKGQLSAVNRQVYLAESQGSAGVLLTSPTKYGYDLVVSYDVMALRPGTVLVTLLSLSNKEDGGLQFDEDYDANLRYIMNSTNAYMIAFLNSPHNRYPFINRFPAKNNPLVEDKRSHMQPGVYYHIDVGREKDHIWLAIDGEKIIEAVDPDPLGEGHFSFRIRGTAAETASCLIRNVKIYSR